jgi:hypothetical protein
MSISEKPYFSSFRISELPDSVFRTEIGRISGQSKGQMAGCRQGVAKHLFSGFLCVFAARRSWQLLPPPAPCAFQGAFHRPFDAFVEQAIVQGTIEGLRK